VREEYLDGQRHLELEIQRFDYENMIAHHLERTLTCIHQSMQDARLIPKDVDKLMLVGGSTRTPMVHRLLQERMQLEPRWEIDPDLIVAMGAAIQGAIIGGEKHHSILVDITPHTFSTSSLGHFDGVERIISTPIIPRNTPLPASKSEIFFTLYDHQDSVKVDARQGESRLPEQNTFIGEFLVEGLSKVPAGNPVVIHFDLDLNGMLKVTATEKSTGLGKTVTMDTRGKHVLDVDEARRNIASLVGQAQDAEVGGPPDAPARFEPEGAVPEILLSTAKDLRKRGELLLGRNINAEDAEEVRGLIHASAEAITARDWASLSQKNDTLSDLLFYLED
jgi:molecular chaperone DnaK